MARVRPSLPLASMKENMEIICLRSFFKSSAIGGGDDDVEEEEEKEG